MGLQRADVDRDGGVVAFRTNRVLVADQSIEGTLKGGRSRRVEIGPDMVAALRAHLARQATERLKAGAAWTDSGHLFTNEVGEPLNPHSVSQLFDRRWPSET